MIGEDLVQRLGLPGDLPHLEEALTHPSYSNEQRLGKRADNQRLEFLGDSVLGLCVSEILMERFPAAREGELSLMRAALVNTDALAAWARIAGVGAALRLGRGADAAGERKQKNVLADAVEALMGAVYLDCGIEAARRLSAAIVAAPLERMTSGPPLGRDPKSELQERVQAEGNPSPRYRIIGIEGPDHSREFIAVVEVGSEVLGTGTGRSKKLAEQEAARVALQASAAAAPHAEAGSPEPCVDPADRTDTTGASCAMQTSGDASITEEASAPAPGSAFNASPADGSRPPPHLPDRPIRSGEPE